MRPTEFLILSVTLPPHDGERCLNCQRMGIVRFAHGSGSSRVRATPLSLKLSRRPEWRHSYSTS